MFQFPPSEMKNIPALATGIVVLVLIIIIAILVMALILVILKRREGITIKRGQSGGLDNENFVHPNSSCYNNKSAYCCMIPQALFINY